MDQDQSALSQEELLKPQQHPFLPFLAGTINYLVWDTMEVFLDQEDLLQKASSIGFEPYAVMPEMDIRPEVFAKAKLQGIAPMRAKIYMKRPRAVEVKV